MSDFLERPASVLVGIANPATVAPLMSLGARLARASSADLTAIRLVTVPQQISLGQGRALPEVAGSAQLLEEAIVEGAANGAAVGGVIEMCRAVHEGLASAVRKRGIDLLVMGSSEDPDPRTESRFEKLMDRVAQAVECGVIVARFRAAAWDRVLVPVAVTRDLPLVAFAVRALVDSGTSAVQFLHVVRPDDDQEAAADAVARALSDHGLAGLGPLEVVVSPDPAGAVIGLTTASDVTVVGSLLCAGRNGPFGPVAEDISQGSPGSVLVVRGMRA